MQQSEKSAIKAATSCMSYGACMWLVVWYCGVSGCKQHFLCYNFLHGAIGWWCNSRKNEFIKSHKKTYQPNDERIVKDKHKQRKIKPPKSREEASERSKAFFDGMHSNCNNAKVEKFSQYKMIDFISAQLMHTHTHTLA